MSLPSPSQPNMSAAQSANVSSTPEPMEIGSPEGSPPTTAVLQSPLAIAKTRYKRARCVSMELRKEFEELSRELEPPQEPDEERVEPNRTTSIQLASLGIELASREQEAILLEQHIVTMEEEAGILSQQQAENLHEVNRRRLYSAGDDKWAHMTKKKRLEDPGSIRLMEPSDDPGDGGMAQCILALYRKCDGLEKTRKRPSKWRQDSLTYYAGSGCDHGKGEDSVWCHISGRWQFAKNVKAAHIVPFFLDIDSIGEILFGSRSQSLKRAGNSLLLSDQIKSWFDKYCLVVVPMDATEQPITRWRTDIISSDIHGKRYEGHFLADELHKKELVFLNDKRPVSRFLYFHFIMALVRIKSIKRYGWQDIWAQYYQQRPFPTPGHYLRKSMLLALTTFFGTSDIDSVDSWIRDNGFEGTLTLYDAEATEAARRVHEAVENAIARVEEKSRLVEEGLDDSSDDSSDCSSEEDD